MVLALYMVFSLIPTAAFAAETAIPDPAKQSNTPGTAFTTTPSEIPQSTAEPSDTTAAASVTIKGITTKYLLFDAAFDAAYSAACDVTLTLLKDVTVSYPLAFNKGFNITLDLGGNVLRADHESYALQFGQYSPYIDSDADRYRNNGTLTVTNGKLIGSRGICNYFGAVILDDQLTMETDGCLVSTYGGKITVDGAQLHSENGIGVALMNTFSVLKENDANTNSRYNKNAEFEMTSGTINAAYPGIIGDMLYSGGTKADVTGGSIISRNNTAIYWPMEGTLTISGDASITGATALEAKMGSICISDNATMTGTAKSAAPHESDDPLSEGSAVLFSTEQCGNIPGQYKTDGALTANINGGTFISKHDSAIKVYNTEQKAQTAKISIAAGTVSGAESDIFYVPTEKSDISTDNNGNQTIKKSNTELTVSSAVTPVSVSVDGKTAYFSDPQAAIDHFKKSENHIEVTLFGNSAPERAIALSENITFVVTPNVTLHGTVIAADPNKAVDTQTDANGNTVYQVTQRPITDYAASILDGNGTLQCFDTLQAAVNAVQNGQTIVLHRPNAEKVVVSRAINFEIDPGTITENTYKITAGSGFVLSQNGNEYTISVHHPSTGGSSASRLYTVSVDSAVHGTASASTHYARKDQTVTITVNPDDGYTLKRLSIITQNDKTVPVKSKDTNQYTFTMPNSNVKVYAEFKKEEYVFPFTDISRDDWFFNAVEYVYTEGMMNGTSHLTFSPRESTTRGMIVTILWRMEGSPQAKVSNFPDVTTGQYYNDAVSWAHANNIVKGYGNGLFGPNDRITREQMAAILYRYSQYKGLDVSSRADLSCYSDANQIASYAETALSWANAEKFMIGTSAAKISPKGYASRAEAASILMRFCEHFSV